MSTTWRSKGGRRAAHHREALEAEAERPAVPVREPALGEDVRVDDAAAKHLRARRARGTSAGVGKRPSPRSTGCGFGVRRCLHPAVVVQDLELEGRLGEREVLADPPLLHAAEQMVAQPLERRLRRDTLKIRCLPRALAAGGRSAVAP